MPVTCVNFIIQYFICQGSLSIFVKYFTKMFNIVVNNLFLLFWHICNKYKQLMLTSNDIINYLNKIPQNISLIPTNML